jgi:hypothetical protein
MKRHFALRDAWRVPLNPGIAVDFGTMEIKSKAQSLLGTHVHRVSVLRVSLGPAVQAFSLLPAAGYFPSCSDGEAAFQERTVPDAGTVCIHPDQTCN